MIINAQTGEVSGKRPWSWAKITTSIVAVTTAFVMGGFLFSVMHGA